MQDGGDPDRGGQDRGDEVTVRVRRLAKTFPGGVAAVADASFEARRGEVLGLLGPNGAGKSTTLKIMAGLVFPSAGRVELCGLPAPAAVARGLVAYLPERPSLHEHLTSEGVLRLAGALAGLPGPARRRAADQLIERFGLASARGRAVRRLSAGTRQRLALAQALVGAPRVLLLDEPMNGLDPLAHREARARLLELRAAGTTVVLSTHLLPDVETMCDRVAILVAGRVRRVAAPGALGEPLEAALVREAAAAAGAGR
jgi:ABC-2 type transport system ATP-binding protein